MNAADTARRLVEDVQRLGLYSASAVVERYAVAVEQTLGSPRRGAPTVRPTPAPSST